MSNRTIAKYEGDPINSSDDYYGLLSLIYDAIESTIKHITTIKELIN